MKKVHKKYLIVIVIIFAFVARFHKGEYKNPELVCTIKSMSREYCSIIVHKNRLMEKTELALFLVELCRENNFDNIKFSIDVRGYPSSLSLNVYLTEKDFQIGNQYMNVRYEMIECRKDSNIKDNPENYQIYIDDEFYKI